MAGLQEGEKQLFEKFWRGTFKAVATPRPGSVIVASITARKNVTNTEQSTCPSLKADQSETKPADATVVTAERSRRIKARGRKHGSRRRMRSLSFDDDLTPRPTPKSKKKKKKSERKRRRRRSPSYSLSPVRKKKKKKKSSKKRKRNRSVSKKRRHSCTHSKSKRKEDRKHKKRSRSRAHRRRRYRRSESESSCTDSRRLRRSAERAQSEGPARHRGHRQNGHASTDQTGFEWRTVNKSTCTTPPNFHSAPSDGSIVQSGSGGDIFTKKGLPHDILSNQRKGRQDYDSGNDTSSPPSTKTNLSRSKVNEDRKSLCVQLPSPEKLRFTDGDNASDSGNSVTSYSSLCKPLPLEKGSENHVNGSKPSYGVVLRRPKFGVSRGRSPSPPRGRSRSYSRSSSRSRSRSRSRSSRSSRRSSRYSRSRSLSSRRSYSHSPSYAAKSRSRRRSMGSGSSHRSSSYSRYTPSRSREPERRHKKYGSCEKQARRGRERHRRKSYSPMRKRRRDSPSHLEARRITSARKRPIPYYRPSPSSTSPSTSYSSWCSLFTRSRSRSRSPTRSRSFSSYRSYSRSSWSTLSGRSPSPSPSPSQSYDSIGSYGRARH